MSSFMVPPATGAGAKTCQLDLSSASLMNHSPPLATSEGTSSVASPQVVLRLEEGGPDLDDAQKTSSLLSPHEEVGDDPVLLAASSVEAAAAEAAIAVTSGLINPFFPLGTSLSAPNSGGGSSLDFKGGAASAAVPSKSRQPHVFTDLQGNEKKFGSALGLLTRKFVDLILSSPSGAVDMNESAILLQVPKRRIYDITNVLEGVGLIEKRSKNTVAWKGSEAILGSALDPAAKEEMIRLRREITNSQKEEATLEHWIARLLKSHTGGHMVRATDIVTALFHPPGPENMISREMLVDESGKPRRVVIAVHCPFDGVAQILKADHDDMPERHLYIGTKEGLEKYNSRNDEADSKKRKGAVYVRSQRGSKVPRLHDKLEVFYISTAYDEVEGRIRAHSVQFPLDSTSAGTGGVMLEILESKDEKKGDEETVKRSSSWDVAESLANDEGVSDFFDPEDTV